MNGKVPINALEDRTRNAIGGDNRYEPDVQDLFEDAKDSYENAEDNFKETSYSIGSRWIGQKNYVEVWLEKEALSRLFSEVTHGYQVKLVTCRGYPSLTFMWENIRDIKAILQEQEEIKTCHILFFGDYDPSGRDIIRHIQDTFFRFGLYSKFKIETNIIAITAEQIEQYNIPPMPTKHADPRTNKWITTHGDVAVELDAIDPNELQLIIRKSIEDLFDDEIYDKKEELVSKGQEKLTKMVEEYLTQSAAE